MSNVEDTLAHVPGAVVQVSTTGNWRITGANHLAAGLLGYESPEQLRSVDLSDLCHSPDAWDSLRHSLASPANTAAARLRRRDGSLLTMGVRAGAARDGHLLIAFLDDGCGPECESFAIVVGQSPIATEQYDANGLLLDVNQACLDLFGLTNVDAVRNMQLFKDPDSEEDFRCKLARGEVDRREHDFDFDLVREAGQLQTSKSGVIRIEALTSALRRSDGSVRGYLVHVWDITERHRLRQDLAEHQADFAEIFEQSPIAIEQYDTDGLLVNANRACLDLLGLTGVEAILGFQLFGAPQYEAEWRATLSRGETVHYEHTFSFERIRQQKLYETCKRGEMRLAATVSPLRRANGELKGYLRHVRDVSERFEAVRAIKESEEKYRQLFSTVTDAIVIFDTATGRFVEVNQAAMRLFGYSRSEFLALSYLDISAERNASSESFGQLLAGQAIRIPRRYYRRKDGTVFPVEISASPMTIAGRKLMCGVVRDITEREKTDAELRQSESMLAEAQRITHLGSWDWDCVDDVLIWSDETYRIFGLEPRSIAGLDADSFFSRIHPDDVMLVREAINKFLYEKAPYRVQHRVIHPDGTERTVIEQGTCTYDEHDQPLRTIGTVLDVTDQRHAEMALRESEEKYRSLAENTDDVIFSLATDGTIAYVSPQVIRYGRPIGELVGRPFAEFLSAEDRDRVVAEFQDSMVNGAPVPSEFRIVGGDGRLHWVEERANVQHDTQGNIMGLMGVLRDISLRKESEHEALGYQNQLRSLAMELSLAEERERKNLAVTLHDDLVQLLSVAKMRLSLLDNLANDPTASECLAETVRLVDRAVRFTRSLMLHLSHPALYEMGLVAATEWLVEDMQELHNLKVTLSGFQDADPLDQRTRVVLFQCMRELLVNVAKHANAASASVRITSEDEMVRVIVEDDGIGFDPEAGRSGGDGTQFGLFSIRERIRMLGGQVTIRSAAGKGTTINVLVPIIPAEDTLHEGKTTT